MAGYGCELRRRHDAMRHLSSFDKLFALLFDLYLHTYAAVLDMCVCVCMLIMSICYICN